MPIADKPEIGATRADIKLQRWMGLRGDWI
jgi:hypothetical protein